MTIALAGHRSPTDWSALLRRFVRYGAVSVVATLTSLTVLSALVATRAMAAAWANVVATAVGTVPSFELNRRWVWGKQGERSVRREVVPFALLSFAGLGLSTAAVAVTAAWADSAGLGDATRTIAVNAANLTAFGVLWIVQYLLLDRVLFAPGPAAPVGVSAHRQGPSAQCSMEGWRRPRSGTAPARPGSSPSWSPACSSSSASPTS